MRDDTPGLPWRQVGVRRYQIRGWQVHRHASPRQAHVFGVEIIGRGGRIHTGAAKTARQNLLYRDGRGPPEFAAS